MGVGSYLNLGVQVQLQSLDEFGRKKSESDEKVQKDKS